MSVSGAVGGNDLRGRFFTEVGFLQRSVFTFGAKTTPASGKILRRRARGGTVTYLGEEEDFYEGEIRDMVLSVLTEAAGEPGG